jgi:hypothetical protein
VLDLTFPSFLVFRNDRISKASGYTRSRPGVNSRKPGDLEVQMGRASLRVIRESVVRPAEYLG